MFKIDIDQGNYIKDIIAEMDIENQQTNRLEVKKLHRKAMDEILNKKFISILKERKTYRK